MIPTAFMMPGPVVLGFGGPETLKAMRWKGDSQSVDWVLLAAGGIILLGLLFWIRARFRSKKTDKRILAARGIARHMTPDERRLLQRIADERDLGGAADIAERMLRYDDSVAKFLKGENLEDADRRERLAAQLASLRTKLGFKNLSFHRGIPSTREVRMGTELSVRPDGRPNAAFGAAVAHVVNDIEMKIRFVTDSRETHGSMAAPPPVLEVGDRLEIGFAHGDRRRCRLRTVVAAQPEQDGTIVSIAHASIDTIFLSRDRKSEVRIEGVLTTDRGDAIDVVIREVTTKRIQLSVPLSDPFQEGSIVFRLPGTTKSCKVSVTRPKPSGDTATPAQRSILQFGKMADESRQMILRFIRSVA
jgi:hypothetical protein